MPLSSRPDIVGPHGVDTGIGATGRPTTGRSRGLTAAQISRLPLIQFPRAPSEPENAAVSIAATPHGRGDGGASSQPKPRPLSWAALIMTPTASSVRLTPGRMASPSPVLSRRIRSRSQLRASHVVGERRARLYSVEGDDGGRERARSGGTPVSAGAALAAEDVSNPRQRGTQFFYTAGAEGVGGFSSGEAFTPGRDSGSSAAPHAEKVSVGDVAVSGGGSTNGDSSDPRPTVLLRDGSANATSRVTAVGVSPGVETPGGDAAAGTGSAAGATVVLWRGEKKRAGTRSWHQAESGRSSDETCAICLAEYEGGCLLRVIVPCGHMFHTRRVGCFFRLV